MNPRMNVTVVGLGIVLVVGAVAAQIQPGEPAQLSCEELVKILEGPKEKHPMIIQVGFRVMYQQAHIPGSEYIGPASGAPGTELLRKRVEKLPRNEFIVLYCGCCPWEHCPNVKPAAKELVAMGFKNVKVLYIANNFGADWVDKGYPVEKGQ